MLHYKELYIAKTVEELNKIVNKKYTSCLQITSLKSTAKKLYQEIQSDPLDEEKTYVHSACFIKIYEHLLAKNDKIQIELLLGKEAEKASIQLKYLTEQLNFRYHMASQKTDHEESKSKTIECKEMVHDDVNPTLTMKNTKSTRVFLHKKLFITGAELNEALGKFNLLVIDIRPENDYQRSHMLANCINIPEELICGGSSANSLEKVLPKESVNNWRNRDSFDAIVLLDWFTTITDYAVSRLPKLRTIFTEWDINRKYNEPPVILDSGYAQWVEMYPTLCTNSHMRYECANIHLDELLNLDDFDYPLEISKTDKAEKVDVPKEIVSEYSVSDVHEGDSEETTEQKLLRCKEEYKNIQNKIANECSISELNELKNSEKITAIAIEKLREEQNAINKNENLIPKKIPSLIEEQKKTDDLKHDIHQRKKLLDQARRAKKPNISSSSVLEIKPVVSRENKPKPKAATTNPFLLEQIGRLDSTGLNGLLNIHNSCYMNTIIQCLRHIPQVIDFYCIQNYKEIIHEDALISQEFGDLVQSLWNTNFSTIKPIEFYDKFGNLLPMFKEGRHEDCLEFFTYLFNFLSDDCARESLSKNYWSEKELAWYKQHYGKLSYFKETFYYQIKILQKCIKCKQQNLKYEIENVLYLDIPNTTFHLQESIDKFMESNEKYICKTCTIPKGVIKNFCHFPEVLVINLKRHTCTTQNNNFRSVTKNSSCCIFPIYNLKVDGAYYSLKAIAMHTGCTTSGHYTAACLNPFDKNWYLFNDGEVGSFEIYERSVGSKAYVFFYSIQPKPSR
ncbi:hypothetical protein FQA39_LY06478 [Lamprigera yunnana]|nr:hypothetical protein FQA39_LY06478 [Lamprigera yunnana]